MANYRLTGDPVTGLVTSRIVGFMSEEEAAIFADKLLDLTTATRHRFGRLRILFDNRQGAVFSTLALEALDARLKATHRDGDLTAVLVANGINKLQAQRSLSGESRVFVNEADALGWLTMTRPTALAS